MKTRLQPPIPLPQGVTQDPTIRSLRQKTPPNEMLQHHQPGRNDESGSRARARHCRRAAARTACGCSHAGGGRIPRHARGAMGGRVRAVAVPADIVETLRQAFVAAMSVPEMEAAFARGGMVVPRRSALADAKGWLRGEMASWRRDVEETGIVVEE